MEAATPLHLPRVRVQGDVLAVDGLTVPDPTAVRLALAREEAGEDVAALVRDAVEIGARVLDREQTAADTDFVRAEFEKSARAVETEFGERARVAGETLAEALEVVFDDEQGTFARALERHFSDDSTGAVQHKVREAVAETMRGAREEIVRAFSAGDGSPLGEFKEAQVRAIADAGRRHAEEVRGLQGRLAQLTAQVEGLRAERAGEEDLADEQERGTAKGRTYEEQVCGAIDEIAAAQGDDCEATGDLPGATGKTGDVVVEIDGARGPARGRVVFEAKDRRLGRRRALDELDAAMENRDADFGVLVVPTAEELPAGTRALREVGGDKLFVVHDAADGSSLTLEVAYALARARVTMAREEGEGVDAGAVRERVESALTQLEATRKVKTQLTGVTKNAEGARVALEAMEAAVRAQLTGIDALLEEPSRVESGQDAG